MQEQEAEKRIADLIKQYCFTTKTSYIVLYDFLFAFGGLYKINDVLNQIEPSIDEDGF